MTSSRPRLLITGIFGNVGRYLMEEASRSWNIIGIARDMQRGLSISVTCLDLADISNIEKHIEALSPGACIHLAAYSRPADCMAQPALSKRINVDATAEIGRVCAKANIPMVFTSTDMVFDGQVGAYTEESPAHPLNLYGQQKFMAEQVLRSVHPDAVICRMPLMMGQAGTAGTNFFDFMVKKLAQNEPIELFKDEFRSSISLREGARALLWALEQKPGVYHCGGPDRMSRADIGLVVADLMGVSSELIVPVPVPEELAASRPRDVSLDSGKAKRLGFAPVSLKNGLAEFFQD